MKKLLLACLLLTGWSQAQNITFKDPHFKNFIVNYWNYDTQGNKVKVDLNNDGEISVDESLTLGDIVINDTNIVSLDDIENFINLRGFYLRNNKNIDSIDLSKLTNLQTLDIDNLENLIYLNLSNTKVDNFYNSFFLSNLPQITTLIFSNTPIRYLSFGSNNLTNVEISNNPNLWFLSIYGPKLTNIDISTDTNLSNLYLNNTKISNLDLSKNIELIDLGLNNEIKNLDLSNNLKLDSLTTGTNLQYLNLKKGSHMSY